jgi:hypothetical protein
MKHNYRLSDFKMAESPVDTDITDVVVALYLKEFKNIPDLLRERIERDMNNTLDEYEKKINMELPIDRVDFEVTLEIDTTKNTFRVGVYIGSDITMDGIERFDYIPSNDSDYQPIKRFFFEKLNEYVVGQIEQIKSCIE